MVLCFLGIKIENSDKKVDMNLVLLLGQFFADFGVHSGPQIGTKTNPNKYISQVNFWNFFVGSKALQVSLESRLEPLMLVLKAPKTSKICF